STHGSILEKQIEADRRQRTGRRFLVAGDEALYEGLHVHLLVVFEVRLDFAGKGIDLTVVGVRRQVGAGVLPAYAPARRIADHIGGAVAFEPRPPIETRLLPGLRRHVVLRLETQDCVVEKVRVKPLVECAGTGRLLYSLEEFRLALRLGND